MSENIFEKASKLGLTYQTSKGIFNTDDLWKFDKEFLNSLAITLHSNLEKSTVSFITSSKESYETSCDRLRLQILKHIIEDKLNEEKEQFEVSEKLRKKENLLRILNEKQTDSLKDKSIEELQKEIEELGL